MGLYADPRAAPGAQRGRMKKASMWAYHPSEPATSEKKETDVFFSSKNLIGMIAIVVERFPLV